MCIVFNFILLLSRCMRNISLRGFTTNEFSRSMRRSKLLSIFAHQSWYNIRIHFLKAYASFIWISIKMWFSYITLVLISLYDIGSNESSLDSIHKNNLGVGCGLNAILWWGRLVWLHHIICSCGNLHNSNFCSFSHKVHFDKFFIFFILLSLLFLKLNIFNLFSITFFNLNCFSPQSTLAFLRLMV